MGKLKIPPQFYMELPEFKRRYLHEGLKRHFIQTYDLEKAKDPELNPHGYKCKPIPITDEILIEHFYFPPKKTTRFHYGCLAIDLNYKNKAKAICIDIDDLECKTKVEQSLRPHLNELGIDHFVELGGDNNDRGHLWIPLEEEMDLSLLEGAMTRILQDINMSFGIDFDEIYPLFTKRQNGVSLPCRFNLKRGKRYPSEWKGELYYEPHEVLAMANRVKLTPKSLIESLIPEKSAEDLVQTKPIGFDRYLYSELDLPLPTEDVPDYIRPAITNCQAINGVINDIANKKFLDKKGASVHDAGLFVRTICTFNDVKSSMRSGLTITQGEEYFNHLRTLSRGRDDGSHYWSYSTKKIEKEPDRYFPSCQAWERFGKCEGCPARGQIKSPKAFISGKKISKRVIKEVTLSTLEEMRQTTFPELEKDILQAFETKQPLEALNQAFQQAGKSYWASEFAAKLRNSHGKKILFVVPYANLAIDLKNRLQDLFQTPSFFLLSHKSIFTYIGEPEDCPSYDQIQHKSGIGVSAGSYKNEFCKSCKFLTTCMYPRQYQEVLSPEHDIVIIQHSHLQCQEVMYDLLKKQFDIVFIDESFIDNCYATIKISSIETKLLNEFIEFPWVKNLIDWVNHNEVPTKQLKPKDEDLDHIHKVYRSRNLNYNLPDLIRYYNQKRIVNAISGIEVISELPHIPVKVLLDATPPLKLTEYCTNINNFKVYGNNKILDVKKIHPENRIIQVLDASMSQSYLGKNLNYILHKFGTILTNVFPPEYKTLLTCYTNREEEVAEWIQNNLHLYPDLDKKITYAYIEKGTNSRSHFDIQILLAGVYYHGDLYAQDVYKFKSIMNHYRRKYGRQEVLNPYPYYIDEQEEISSCILAPETVKRIEYLNNETAVLVEYPDFQIYPPAGELERLIYDYNVSKTQQTVRVRFSSDKPRYVYILGNIPMPSLIVTDSITEEEFYRSLPSNKHLW